jgi:hypothetical protein
MLDFMHDPEQKGLRSEMVKFGETISLGWCLGEEILFKEAPESVGVGGGGGTRI